MQRDGVVNVVLTDHVADLCEPLVNCRDNKKVNHCESKTDDSEGAGCEICEAGHLSISVVDVMNISDFSGIATTPLWSGY